MFENPVVWEFGAFCTNAIGFWQFSDHCAQRRFPPFREWPLWLAFGGVDFVYQIFFFFWSRIDQWTSHMPSLWFARGWLLIVSLGLRSDLCHSVSCQCFCFFLFSYFS